MDYLFEILPKEVVVYSISPFIYNSAEDAAKYDDFTSMKLMWNEGIRVNKCAENAASCGNIELLKWLLAKNYNAVLYSHALREAVANNQLETVDWLCKIGCFRSSGVEIEAKKTKNSDDRIDSIVYSPVKKSKPSLFEWLSKKIKGLFSYN